MTVDEMLKRYGLKPEPTDLPAIREELSWEIDPGAGQAYALRTSSV